MTPFMDTPLASNPQYHSSYCEARAGKHHRVANGCHQPNIWRAELSKQNPAKAKSKGNKRVAGGKSRSRMNFHEISVLNIMRCHVRHEFFSFKYVNSCFFSKNHRSHKIVANKTYCAYCLLLQVDNRLERRERDDVNIPTPQASFRS